MEKSIRNTAARLMTVAITTGGMLALEAASGLPSYGLIGTAEAASSGGHDSGGSSGHDSGGSAGGHDSGGSTGGHDSGSHGTRAGHKGHGSGQHGGSAQGKGADHFGGGSGTSGDADVPEGIDHHGGGSSNVNITYQTRFRYWGGRNLPDDPPPPPTDDDALPLVNDLVPGSGGGPTVNPRALLHSAGRCDEVSSLMSPSVQYSGENLIRLNVARTYVDPELAAADRVAPPYLMGSLQTELVKTVSNTELAGTYLGLMARTSVSSETVKKIGFQLCADLSDDSALEIAQIAELQRTALVAAKAREANLSESPVQLSFADLEPEIEPEVEINSVGAQVPELATESMAITGMFDFDRAILRRDTRRALDREVRIAKADGYGFTSITVGGHADIIGSASYNLRLSEKRAETVKSYLVSQGVPANIIVTHGFGHAKPATGSYIRACSGAQPRKTLIACLQPHRRVEVEMRLTPVNFPVRDEQAQVKATNPVLSAEATGTSGRASDSGGPDDGAAPR